MSIRTIYLSRYMDKRSCYMVINMKGFKQGKVDIEN